MGPGAVGCGGREGGGDEEVVLGFWQRGEDVFGESFRTSRWVVDFSALLGFFFGG